MAALLQIVGFVWAAIGAFNLFGMDWTNAEASTVNGFAIIFNMVLFIIPGLILGGMGHSMQKKQKSAVPKVDAHIVERLARLDGLLAAKAISRDEYDLRREQILKDI